MERGKLHMRTFPLTFGRYYGTCLLVDLVRGQSLPTHRWARSSESCERILTASGVHEYSDVVPLQV